MRRRETVRVVRAGGKYELIGFLLIALGIVLLFFVPAAGIVLGIVGLGVFIFGRFF